MVAALIPLNLIQEKIHFIRGRKVMLDADLAKFYGVKTSNLNKAVRRNLAWFPSDFMFPLSNQEVRDLRFQIGISSSGRHGGRRYEAYAFTEQGVAMLSAVLKSKRAVLVSIQFMRSFVKLRELVLSNETFSRRLKALESKTDEHTRVIVQILQELE